MESMYLVSLTYAVATLSSYVSDSGNALYSGSDLLTQLTITHMCFPIMYHSLPSTRHGLLNGSIY